VSNGRRCQVVGARNSHSRGQGFECRQRRPANLTEDFGGFLTCSGQFVEYFMQITTVFFHVLRIHLSRSNHTSPFYVSPRDNKGLIEDSDWPIANVYILN
jgi:hypothetical protein